jgi:hypothetical protein
MKRIASFIILLLSCAISIAQGAELRIPALAGARASVQLVDAVTHRPLLGFNGPEWATAYEGLRLDTEQLVTLTPTVDIAADAATCYLVTVTASGSRGYSRCVQLADVAGTQELSDLSESITIDPGSVLAQRLPPDPSEEADGRWITTLDGAWIATDAPPGSGATTLLELTDGPATYGTANQVLAINITEDGWEWVDQSGGGGTLPWSSITSTPTTLSGYGITDAATFAQGALADTALQPNTAISVSSLQLTGGIGTQGTFSWNTDESTVDLILGNSTLPIGQAVQYSVENGSGGTIDNGTVVMAAGFPGASGKIKAALMDGTDPLNNRYCLGVAAESFIDGANGKVTRFGKVRDIDTHLWSPGTVLWVSSTSAGALTSTEPTAPAIGMPIAFVIVQDETKGVIFVRVTPIDEHAGATYEQGTLAASALQLADIDTLAEINSIISDATLIDTSDSRLSDARAPTAHASSHQNGGSDEIATATPAANAIPKAGAAGTIATGWLPDLSGTYITTETNDLETDGAAGIADDEMVMGSGAGTAAYIPMPSSGTNGCSGSADKLLYNTATNTFSCGADVGTVTSVAITGSDGLQVDSGSPITSSGTIALGVDAATLATHLGLGSAAYTASTAYEPAGVAAADITDATADGIALITSADANPFTDADESKLDGIEAGADITDEANVIDSLDGATLTDVGTPASADRVLLQDASDSGALKTADFSEFGGGGGAFAWNFTAPAPTTGDVTPVAGDWARVDISGITADRYFVLPTCSAGDDPITVEITATSATDELVIKGDTGVTVGGVTAAEWSRIWIKPTGRQGETVRFVCVATNTWAIDCDGRIRQSAEMYLSVTTETSVANTYIRPTQASTPGTWVADHDIGQLLNTAGDSVTVRRTGRFFITTQVNALHKTIDQISVRLTDGTNYLVYARDPSASGIPPIVSASNTQQMTAGTEWSFEFKSVHGDGGLLHNQSVTRFGVTEVF